MADIPPSPTNLELADTSSNHISNPNPTIPMRFIQSALCSTFDANVGQKGNTKSSLLSKHESSNEWIVDSRASDHMTRSSTLFSSYRQCDGEVEIIAADKSSSIVVGIGDLNLSGLQLKYVLHVPSLQYNLISTNKLTKDHNCTITFSTHCEFQDLYMETMISNAKERNGLYYFSASPSRPGTLKKFSLFSTFDSNIFLWHNHLSYPNFNYLKYLYPDLFLNKDVSSFNCEHCIFAKQTHKHHPNHSYHVSKPFRLIHNDIWGSACVPNITGT